MNGDGGTGTDTLIHSLAEASKEVYAAERREISFGDYLDLVRQTPRRHARSAAQYVTDCFAWFGVDEETWHLGTRRRYRLFAHVPEGTSEFPVEGLEEVQEEIHEILCDFATRGYVDRLILLHGPNGSAKSSLIGAVARALETYSRTDEGSLYGYSWVFPVDKIARRRLGFGDEAPRASDLTSYASLPDSDTACTLKGELHESPLLLLHPTDRQRFLTEVIGDDSFQPGRAVMEGAPSLRSKKVFDALLRAYEGDLEQVLRHVRVERFYLSRRYRTGLATVEPQIHVDASVRQLTYDQGIAALPPTLKNVTIEEVYGDLVDANRGMVDFNDLLKRPIEAFKYLLATCEKSTVEVPGQILPLDLVFVGSSNETYLGQFKQSPEFASFKGRIELVRVPYLRDYEAERRVYDAQVRLQIKEVHVAPHTTLLAAIWAVMTRMRRPDPERYPREARGVVEELGPLGKADLYARGAVPVGLDAEGAARLRAIAPDLYRETDNTGLYEGRLGASPREVKTILFNAAHLDGFGCLSPRALLAEIEDFVKDRSLYVFLKLDPDGAYHDHKAFLGLCQTRYRELITQEVRTALGLVGDGEFLRLLERYLSHVAHQLRGERLVHPQTGQLVEPNRELMAEFEGLLGVEEKEAPAFRQRSVQRIGAFRVEHPELDLHLESLFADELGQARRTYHERHARKARRAVEAALDLLQGGGDHLDPPFRAEVAAFLDRYGAGERYCEHCLREGLSEFLREPPADD